MLIGRPVSIEALSTAHGSLLETPEGYTRRGLDLDALRMYLRWRGTTLPALRADPDGHRDPTSLPPRGVRNDPGDGAVGDGPPVADGGSQRLESDPADEAAEPAPVAVGPEVIDGVDGVDGAAVDDPWGAESFLDDVEGTAYGTTPSKLRDGLEVVADTDRETVWYTPGIPFVVPMFVGLVVALTYGDVLFVLLQVLGLLP
jgi:preflagellin peptidase FlaK